MSMCLVTHGHTDTRSLTKAVVTKLNRAVLSKLTKLTKGFVSLSRSLSLSHSLRPSLSLCLSLSGVVK